MSRKEEKKISRGNGNSGLMNVARKEFSDHLQSKKLLIIFALFFLISAYSLHVGIEDYQRSLERYKDHIVRIEEVEAEHGVGTGWMPERPSPLGAFIWMSMAMPLLGAVLAIAMGFDVVTKEKQQRTLKTLLSHPVYRDEIINGKAIGGI
ncbi:MAG: ABC transporter permease, partial [Methanophagales archaeon]|nr:ABC transporter permease [Methanophagales archaeon]